jgi:hypothetical protein
MTDSSAVLQRVLLALEATKGTVPTTGWRELGSLSLVPTPQIQAETFKPMGQLWATVGGVNQEHTQYAVEGRGTYTELPFFLAGLLVKTTPNPPPSAVLTRRWTFRPSHATEDDPATYAAQRGTSRRNEEASYLLFNSGQFTYTRQNGLQLGGQALAKLTKDNMAIWLTTTGSPASGNAVLHFELVDSLALPTVTASIAHDASAATVEAALNALATIGENGVSVAGSAGGPYTVTFDGGDVGDRPQDLIELAVNALTGGTSPSVEITEDTPGAEPATDAVQTITITGTPTGGTYKLRLRTARTKGFAYNASAATIQTAIETTPIAASGDVTASGGALSTNPVRIAFGTGRYVDAPPPIVTTTDTFNTGDSVLSTLHPSPTSYTLVPILGKHFSWFYTRSYSDIASATRLTRMFNVQWGIQNRWGVFFPMDDSQESFAGHTVTDPTPAVQFTIGADSNGMQFMSDLRRGDTFFLKGLAQGPIIEVVAGITYRYYFQVVMAIKLTGISERKTEQGLVAVTYTGTLAYDATFGTAIECEVQNTLTTL